MGKLDGKVVIVTGASRGIGRAIARLFAQEGGRVICAARTLREGEHIYEGSLESTVASIRAAGYEAAPVACNLAEEAECRRLVAETRAIYGDCDVLVNNAALTYFFPIVDYPVQKWMRSWAINFHAPFLLSQAVLPAMIAKGDGAIVNISSGAAIGPGRGPYGPERRSVRGGTCYGAQKAALERFTQGLAEEVYAAGIRVACVSPSQVVPTAGTIHHKLVTGMDDPRGEPEIYMARAVLLLATEPLDRVTGRVTYSQQLLHEFGLLENPRGIGVERRGSGYSEI